MFDSEVEGRGWLGAATCRGESRIVHFRQLFQEDGMKLLPLDTVGKSLDKASTSGKAGRGGAFLFFPASTPQ